MSSPETPPASTAVDYDPFAGAALARAVPTTEPQREIWLAATLEPESSLAYNESASLRLRGVLDGDALRGAVQALPARHEALRATLSADGETLHIAERIDLPVELRDLAALDAAHRDVDVAQVLRRAIETPFDLEHGPLLRAELLRLGAEDHLLVLTAHHIVCDGWSFGVIVRDLAAMYAQATGHGEAPAVADSFADFAENEAARSDSDASRDDERYWLARFAGTAPSLDLPTDRTRPRRRSFNSQREDRTLDAGLISDIKRMGAQRKASLYASLLTGFAVLLERLSDNGTIVIGIPAAGQAAGGHVALVGHCVNVLPLRAAVDPQAPFEAVLDQVRRNLLDAFEHQQYTLGSVLKRLALPRDPARLPLVSVLFNLDQALDESTVSFPGLRFEFAANPRAFENFELFVNAVQVDGGARLECQYNSDLFRGDTIRRWLDAYEALLRNAVTAPATAVNALGLLSPETSRELDGLQPAPTPYPDQRLAHEYFELQADRAPARAAVRFGTTRLTYAELEAHANRLAHTLRARGVVRGALVGIALSRGVDMVASVLAVLKAGAGYVPLDPCFPADRLAFMTQDAGVSALIVDDDAPPTFPAAQVVSFKRDADVIAAAASTRLSDGCATPDSIAYVIYTSGSTGRPKGVRVPHRATSNFLTSMQRVPGIAEDDRLVAVTTLSFDIAFMELMLPLSVGAKIVVASRDEVQDGAALRKLVESSDATMLQATPAGWRILIEAGWSGRGGFKAISGGEPLTLALAEALLERCGEVWNGYGPTEATVYSTYWRVANPRDGIYIGRPVANTTVHILDELRAPCPIGVGGEMYIGGAGVTLGYLNRPELDVERFLPDPFSTQSGARLYRTGDRGRWCANGLLEHLGRLDFQVKVRGYRIELGEIEATLTDRADVARAVVMAREDRPGDVRLVAYVVPVEDAAFDESALLTHLKQRLPDYMLPQHLIALPAIPLLPNGKIDRKSLPVPTVKSVAATASRLAPRDECERRVAAAMEAVLALPDLDVRDNFFALGGHSLLAAQLTARLNREFGISLSLRTLFDAPTIAELAAAIGAQEQSGAAPALQPIEHRAEQSRAPLSLMQSRLWSLEELAPGRVTYNAPSAHRLRGHIDEVAFDYAFQELIRRQPSMRTAIRRNGQRVEQVIEADLKMPLFPAEDLSMLPAKEREAALMQRLEALTDTPFDLTRAPLFSARMFRMAEDDHAFFFMPHHIIWDGWSFDILYVELSQLYRAFKDGGASPLPPLPVTYADFAVWHAHWLETPALDTQLKFWRERLAQTPATKALPIDKPRRPGMSGEGRTEWIRVSREATDRLHEVARCADATLNMTLLALYYVLLCASSGQRDLVVATPVRGRNQTEVESVMGYFTNLLPLHATLDLSLPFLDFVRAVKKIVIDSFGCPDVPLEFLQRELGKGHAGLSALYQALFSFQDARQRVTDWGGLRHEQIPLFQRGATEDLGLWFLENANGMVGGVTYNADIFNDSSARVLRDRFLTLLARISEDPQQALSTLTAITPAELKQLRDWNARNNEGDAPDRVVEQFEHHADLTPERTVLTFGSWGTTYAELEQRANRIAACLRARGAKPASVVGLCVEPGVNRIAGLLGILKSGGVCMLLDPTDPVERLKDILADARTDLLLGGSALEAALQWPRARALWFDADTAELIATSNARHALPKSADDTPTFVVYTPRASGMPRGVAITQRGLAARLQGLRLSLGVVADDRVLGTAPPAAGLSLIESLLPLGAGAEFIQASPLETADGAMLAKLTVASHATAMFAPPGAWRSMLSTGWTRDNDLRALNVGECLPCDLAAQLAAGSGEVWNLFATAEAGIVAGGPIDLNDGIHSGHPFAPMRVWVLDEGDQPCPIGAVGRIWVDDDAGSRGFGIRAEADPPRELPDTFSVAADSRLLDSGFRGRWLASGDLDETDRSNRHLNLLGYDIDPAAIEAWLQAQPGVAQAFVFPRNNDAGAEWLDACVVAEPSGTPNIDRMRATLSAILTVHELPRQLFVVDALPRLRNGEVDIARLPTAPDIGNAVVTQFRDQPATPAERLLADLWQELLGVPRVGVGDNFFDLGGHSLLAMTMVAHVEKRTGVRLNLLRIANSTLRALATELPQTIGDRQPEGTTSTLGQRMRKLFGLGRQDHPRE